VGPGDVLVILEAMKMEHEIRAPQAGHLAELFFQAGETVNEGDALARWTRLDAVPVQTGAVSQAKATMAVPSALDASPQAHGAASAANQDAPRADLQKLQDRLAFTQDAQRPEAVAKRHATGLRTARENIADLCDPDSFVEYGALAVAAQSRRRSADDLMRNTPADGMVTGIGCVNGQRVVVMAYDFTVLAGTQGMRNHQKTDRLLGVALQNKLPVVLFAEGGGGRPGDVDVAIVAGLNLATFASFARLNGQVPVVGVVAGRCFAGNAALLGCSDVIIATEGSTLGMGGPAMIEGGGLGIYTPEEVGPMSFQVQILGPKMCYAPT
jgi:acetyl-CoA carboxylase carboxyltransferase component